MRVKKLQDILCHQCFLSGVDASSHFMLYLLKHFQDKGRTDDLFNDSCYEMFGDELNKVLKDWQPSVLPDGKVNLF